MRFKALLLIVLLAIAIPLCSDSSDGATSFESPDGTTYQYETSGSQHSEYQSEITGASSDSEHVIIASALEGYEVRTISEGAFDFPNARLIVVPDCIQSIGRGAFDRCPMLEEVLFLGEAPKIPGGLPAGVDVKTRSDAVFSEASSDGSVIEYIEVSGKAMAIGGMPSEFGSLTIPSSVRGLEVSSIGSNAFAGKDSADGTAVVPRTDIETVTISEGIETIRERAFYYCAGITTVQMPSTLRTIMDEAFRASYSLKDAEIPDGVEYLGFEAFRHCTSLRIIAIPDSVRFIGEGAFKVCSAAESISIGAGLERIGDWAFSYCQSAETLTMRGETVRIGVSAFYSCTSLKEASLPETVREIGDDAFYECYDLERISLGSHLTAVGAGAFRGCSSLKAISFPDTLESMGDKALAYCSGLTDVYFAGDMPGFGSAVFLNVDAAIHCTEAHADSWKGFDGIVVDKPADGGMSVTVIAAVAIAIIVAAVAVIAMRKRSE